MKKYYLHNEMEQEGPFDLEELKAKQISKQTMVWFDGLETWKEAGEISELKNLLSSTPPPFTGKTQASPPPPPKREQTKQPVSSDKPAPTKSGGLWKIIRSVAMLIGVGVLILIAISVVQRATSNRNSTPFKIAINPPSPRIVESHATEDPSSEMFAFREGVWATVLNEGGDGKVLVKAKLYQGANTYERSEELYLGANQTQEFHFVFTEPKRLGADMKFEVTAVSL